MTRTQCRVWLVVSMLMVAVPAGAQVADCSGQPDSTPCIDTDGDICTVAACDTGVCDQQFSSLSPGTPCPDTDGNTCTIARCRIDDTECNQGSAREPEGTACTDGGIPGQCQGFECVAAESDAPALSVVGMAGLTAMLLALGFWQMRRRSVR